MSHTVAQLHHYTEVVAGLGTSGSMQTISYAIGAAFLVFAVTGIWRALTSRY